MSNDIVLGLVVLVALAQLSLWLALHVHLWRTDGTDPAVRRLTLLTALLPLVGVVVPLWYVHDRERFRRDEEPAE